MSHRLASERVVVASPASFTGSAQRLWRLSESPALRWLVLAPAVAMAWALIAGWYLMVGLLVVPWRLVRRGQRRERRDALRHAEALEAARARR